MRLTKPQKLIYDMEKYAGGSINIICGRILRKGTADKKIVHSALNAFYRINDSLRIRIVELNGFPEQVIYPYTEHAIEDLYFDNKAELDQYAQEYAKQPMDFYGELCEVKSVILPDSFGILIKLHHIVADAWTLSLLASQFNAIIDQEDPTAFSYSDYISAESSYLSSKRYLKDAQFFEEQYLKCDELVYLNNRQSSSLEARRKTFRFSKDMMETITAYTLNKKTTPYMLLMTAVAVYISRIKMNAEKFYIGTPVLNRSNYREKATAGMFINTIPVLIELNHHKTFRENLESVEESCLSSFRHERFNYDDILSELRDHHHLSEKLFDVVFSFQNAVINGSVSSESEWFHNGMQSESLQIHIDDRDRQGEYRISYDYLVDKYTENDINKIHAHLLNLLKDAAADDSKRLFELNLLTAEEEHAVYYEYNQPVVSEHADTCFHELLEKTAREEPDRKAIVSEKETLTYQQLNQRADNIAHSLKSKGVKPGDFVAVYLPGSSDFIAAILGVMKTGAAYLPLDMDFTEERINTAVQEVSARIIIDQEYIDSMNADNTLVSSNPDTTVSPDSYCYGICTSGTTGKPKIVGIKHRNLMYYIQTVRNLYPLEYVNMPLFTKPCVDLTVTSIFLPLMSRGTIYIYDGRDLLSSLNRIVVNHNLNMMKLTPTHMQIMSKNIQPYQMTNIRYAVVGGESLTKDVAESFLSSFGSHIEIHNEYGPTETTVGCMDYVYKSEDSSLSVSIGRPFKNTNIYIVDQFNNILPAGAVGELCITGSGVGGGYLNNPEQTAGKFIDNPFGEGKMYRTGDLACWQEDGNICYIGRNDFQVKIHGLRIELEEIENAISSVDGVSRSAVTVGQDQAGRQFLCAYYTAVSPVEIEDIKKQIRKKLPRYMMPQIFTLLNEMPLSSSGKVNRKALPAADLEHLDPNTEYIEPVGELEKTLAGIMESILSPAKVGRQDNFFDLGGDSLKAIEFITQAQSEGIYIKLQSVFDYPTVQKLAEHIESRNETDTVYSMEDFKEIHRYLSSNREYSHIPEKKEMGNILLTGVTGFFGAHILRDYLENEEGTAYCIVRGIGPEDSQKRFKEVFHYYFSEKYDHLLGTRIIILCGDLKKPSFNLPEETYKELLQTVRTVINSAAAVKHYGSYQYFYETNVETVRRLAEFTEKAEAQIIHISTLSISGNGLETISGEVKKEIFTECDLYAGQTLNNVYIRSKFEAEKYLFEKAIAGLPVNIIRIGNLTNRYSDGLFQKNYDSNAFFRRMTGIMDAGVYPEKLNDYGLDFTPVDQAAQAVILIGQHFSSERTVFHLRNSNTLALIRMAEWIKEWGKLIRPVSEEEFMEVLNTSETDKQAFINLLDQDGHLSLKENIQVSSTATDEYLRRIGFEWGKPDERYIKNYVEFIKGTEKEDGGKENA